ncbi:MAG: sulfatase-like hydrolase/transferase [Akkermansiaceae bacterium]
MKIHTILTTLILLAALAHIHAQEAKNARKPNIIFILADDLGYADSTLYGHTKLYQTPNLERLAKQGMTFSRAYAASPLCSPTRASILTGQNPGRLGLTAPQCHLPPVRLKGSKGKAAGPKSKVIQPNSATRLDTKYNTLAKELKKAGYSTGHFGKWHLGPKPYSALQHGFDVDIPNWHGPGPAGNFVAPWRYPDFDPNHPKEHIEDRMAEEAVAFMKKNKDKPFFLNYWQFSVHAPFNAKQELIDKYKKLVDPGDAQRSPTYAAMVESMDDAVGTLLDAVDELGIADNTIVIFFSDNGGNMYNWVDDTRPTSNAPLRGGKASMYEGGIRVPMVVSWPGKIKPETRSDAMVQSVDFYPTLMKMLDIEAPKNQVFDGIDISPAFDGKPLNREAIFTYFPHDPPVPDWMPPAIAVHHGDWKLIREFHQGPNGEHFYRLYNLANDIGEKNNIAYKRPGLVATLDKMIEGFIEDSGTVVPIPNPKFDLNKYQPELEGYTKMKKPGAAKGKKKPARKPKVKTKKNATNSGDKPLNVILVITEDQSTDLGCLGTKGLDTPHIDKFAAEGVNFTRAFTLSPVCSPSKMALLTGTYPHTNSAIRNVYNYGVKFPLPKGSDPSNTKLGGVHEDLPTLIEVLREGGIFTGITFKSHVQPIRKFPFHRGYPDPANPAQARSIINQVVKQSGGGPFFLWFNTAAPHLPFKHYPQAQGKWDPKGGLLGDGGVTNVDPKEIEVPKFYPDTPAVRQDIADYYGAIECVDTTFGAMRAALKQQGMLENTVIIYTSDHGLGMHRAKQSIYAAGLHVPFIVQAPNQKPGRVIKHPISHLDLSPTILDYFGIKKPATMIGKSLRPIINGKNDTFADRPTILTACHRYYSARAVTDGKYYFIRNLTQPKGGSLANAQPVLNTDQYQPGHPWYNRTYEATVKAKGTVPHKLLKQIVEGGLPAQELYDIDTDPGMVNNLLEPGKKHDANLPMLKSQLTMWRKKSGDHPGNLKRRTKKKAAK